MNKRTFKFSILIAGITVAVHTAFVIAQLMLDIFSNNTDLQNAFADVSQFFGGIAEITAYAIVIYAFTHFKPAQACKSFIVAGSVHLSSVILTLVPVCILIGITVPEVDAMLFYMADAIRNAYLGAVNPRIIPTILVAVITYLCTMNGTAGIKSLFSFKNPIQKAMIFSTIAVYLTKVFTAIIVNDLTMITTVIVNGGLLTDTPLITAGEFWLEMWNTVLYPHVKYLVIYLVLQYFVLLLVYFLNKRFTENTPIKKRTKTNSLEEI
ncbi:MAG: hypothetical protein J6A96_03275 [Clostridia bacterium]|nr:hypothetical protein [Clostridia bacterium]